MEQGAFSLMTERFRYAKSVELFPCLWFLSCLECLFSNSLIFFLARLLYFSISASSWDQKVEDVFINFILSQQIVLLAKHHNNFYISRIKKTRIRAYLYKDHPIISMDIIVLFLYKNSIKIMLTSVKSISKGMENSINSSRRSEVVEFFSNSSSEFSDSIISQRCLEELRYQINMENDAIFETLKETLLPRQDFNEEEKISHIIHRAELLYRQSLPSFNKIVVKKNGDSSIMGQISQIQSDLSRLINDYHRYKQDEIGFDTFFNRYGSVKTVKFDKKNEVDTVVLNIIGDQIKVIGNENSQNLFRSSNNTLFRSSFPFNDQIKNKEFKELKEELSRSKNREKMLRDELEEKKWTMERQYMERVSNLITVCSMNERQEKHENVLMEEVEQSTLKYKKALIKIQQLESTVLVLQEQLKIEKQTTNQYLSELQFLKKSSNIQDKQNISSKIDLNSQQIEPKTKKILQRITYQNSLLKKQLANLRQKNQNSHKKEATQLREQNQSMKKELRSLYAEIKNNVQDVDKMKVQNLRLYNQNSRLKKSLELAKTKINTDLSDSSRQAHTLDLFKKQTLPAVCKYFIKNYSNISESDNPFYRLLSKEFKVRYRRCCLKDKDLLFKNEGLEIGVITEYQEPNKLRCTVHFSNSGTDTISQLKLKVSNSNGNQVEINKSEIKELEVGNQKKCVIRLQIKNYPIGQTILSYEFKRKGDWEENRLQLPLSIFKMIKIKAMDGEFIEPHSIKMTVDRKIGKDFTSICSYFGGSTINQLQSTIGASILHEHTDTKLLVKLKQIFEGNYQLEYEHRDGQKRISSQIVGSLQFLLRKDQ